MKLPVFLIISLLDTIRQRCVRRATIDRQHVQIGQIGTRFYSLHRNTVRTDGKDPVTRAQRIRFRKLWFKRRLNRFATIACQSKKIFLRVTAMGPKARDPDLRRKTDASDPLMQSLADHQGGRPLAFALNELFAPLI